MIHLSRHHNAVSKKKLIKNSETMLKILYFKPIKKQMKSLAQISKANVTPNSVCFVLALKAQKHARKVNLKNFFLFKNLNNN